MAQLDKADLEQMTDDYLQSLGPERLVAVAKNLRALAVEQIEKNVRYPLATSILLLCDGGGSNSSRYYLFKQDLQVLANELGIEICIAHYPP